MCRVLNLLTGAEYFYTCTPKEAVVDAYNQYDLGNYNIWTYDYSLAEETKHCYVCGNMAVMKDDDV